MATETLQIFSKPFVAFLRQRLQTNLNDYSSPTPWVLSTDFSAQKSLPTRFEWDNIATLLVAPDDSGRNNDAQNAVTLHRALSFLTAAQATDERLWVRLSHIECWEYMRRRWPAERYADVDKAQRYLLSRYFVPQSQGRALLRNGMARLWWSAHLTYDRHRENPYELTDVLLSRLDIAKNILERSLGRSHVVLRGFLEFLRQNSARFLVGGQRSRMEIRALSKALNLLGGVNLLDALTEEDIVVALNADLEGLCEEEIDNMEMDESVAATTEADDDMLAD